MINVEQTSSNSARKFQIFYRQKSFEGAFCQNDPKVKRTEFGGGGEVGVAL